MNYDEVSPIKPNKLGIGNYDDGFESLVILNLDEIIEDSKKGFREAVTYGYESLRNWEVEKARQFLETAKIFYRGLLQNEDLELGLEYIHGIEGLEERVKHLEEVSL
jgi:hypothetical protein